MLLAETFRFFRAETYLGRSVPYACRNPKNQPIIAHPGPGAYAYRQLIATLESLALASSRLQSSANRPTYNSIARIDWVCSVSPVQCLLFSAQSPVNIMLI